jgi:Ser/Thr protein kinase RdoA (MazF antagonist)
MSGEAAARAMAASALVHWGGAAAEPRLVKWRENIVFDVSLKDGRRAALRLHRPGYQSQREIEAELDWMRRLAAGGFPCPAPVLARSGRMTVRLRPRLASLVGWVEGAQIGSAEARLPGTPCEQAQIARDVGDLIARLHAATDALDLPADLPRQRWDTRGWLGERPLWGRFWENPALEDGEHILIARARDAGRMALAEAARAGADFGLIHADCLRENILRGPDGLTLIDFDDAGWGFRLYDLATFVVQSLEEPNLPGIVAGLLAGYRARRGLSETDAARLPLFVMLRTFASAGWIVTRAEAGDARQRFYAARAVQMARHVLDGTAPWTA